MADIEILMQRSAVHRDWIPLLNQALGMVDRDYLAALLKDENWLPGADNLLAAFRRDPATLRYLLIGESPYPRRESANGIAFYDAAVGSLWSDTGLSTAVNRATSLRNIIKTALLAEGRLQKDGDGKITQQAIAGLDRQSLIQTLADLFGKLENAGFLMLNATPVLHARRKPVVEARYWQGFLDCLLEQLAKRSRNRPVLLLWGKIAKLIETLPASAAYDKILCEHPYNISFIDNPDMHRLLAELRIMQA